MRKALLVVLAVVATLVVGLGVSAFLAASVPEEGAPPVVEPAVADPAYLALGDSVAAGVGVAPLEGDRLRALERWRTDGYPGLFAGVLADEMSCPLDGSAGCPSLQYVNEAVPGATSASLLAGQMPAATALLRERNADDDPRDDVRVVTLTIGGNDVFGPVVEACLTGRGAESAECLHAVGEGLTTFTQNYGRILAELRAAAGPATVIVTTTYYNSLSACTLGRSGAEAPSLADAVLEGGEGPGLPPEGMNDLIRAASARNGAVVAEAYGALKSPGDYVGGQDCLHPNEAGHRRLAEVVAEAWRSAGE